MTSFRHAAYRASLLATSTFRSTRALTPRVFQLAQVARPSAYAFSTRTRLFADGLDQLQSSVGAGAPDAGSQGDGKTLYVGNLYFDVTNQQLRQHFDSYGTIVSARVVTNSEGQSKGYGFIEFSDMSGANAARDALNLSNFAGRRIVVHAAKPQLGGVRSRDMGETEPSSTLFIGNMSYEMTDKELNELFRPLKGIRDVRVSVDRHTGRPRGFAHADFIDVPSAMAAIKQLDGKVIRQRILRADYSNAPATMQSNRRASDINARAARQNDAAATLAASASAVETSPQTEDAVETSPQTEDAVETSPQTEDGAETSAQTSDEGPHEPPEHLEEQAEHNEEQELEQPGEHATQKLEEEIEKVPEEQGKQ